MKVYSASFSISTKGEIDFVDITSNLSRMVTDSGVRDGLVNVFAPHATGVIIITENEPRLLTDIRNVLEKLIPRGSSYSHPGNAHSHLRAVFLVPSKVIPVVRGRLALGTWQSVLFVETDPSSRHRTIIVQVIGE